MKPNIHQHSAHITVGAYETRDGFSVRVGERQVAITVTVDLGALAEKLGRRAAHNRSGRATALEGAVVVGVQR